MDEPNLDQLLDVVGMETTLLLIRTYGGEVHHIPLHPRPDHWLTELVGEAAAAAICERFGGCPLLIPKGVRWFYQRRDREICEARAQGKTVNQLVREFGLTKRRICQVLQAGKQAGQTCTLTAEQAQK